ncbi:hypothetical protein P171DRAFT_436998 [Karstenula rhodostoma CBS 690.94]|uniref:Uncharacterized protein n=1 Tax=Karstenula rhodostoma CBS 690.94 TaxID=1392251 RepID=A0A9P4P537_9PLEO|nr:hypothetical protein P171DRAFT_436998 [Karstenula rhodostoma CBS 690.94]
MAQLTITAPATAPILKRKASVDLSPPEAKKQVYTDAEMKAALSKIAGGLTASRWATTPAEPSSSAFKLARPKGLQPQLAQLVPAPTPSNTQAPPTTAQLQLPPKAAAVNPPPMLNTPSQQVAIKHEPGTSPTPPTPLANQSKNRKKLRPRSRKNKASKQQPPQQAIKPPVLKISHKIANAPPVPIPAHLSPTQLRLYRFPHGQRVGCLFQQVSDAGDDYLINLAFTLLHNSLPADRKQDWVDTGIYEAFMYFRPDLDFGNVEAHQTIFERGACWEIKDAAGNGVVVDVAGKRINEVGMEVVRELVARWNTDHALRSKWPWAMRACKYYYPELCVGCWA